MGELLRKEERGSGLAIWVKLIRQLFAEEKNDNVVRLEKFGKMLGFLPELKAGPDWFVVLESLLRQPW